MAGYKFDPDFAAAKLLEVGNPNSWGSAFLDREYRFYVHTEQTGHMYYGSPYETSDDCGNCNGANCDNCRIRWIIEDGTEPLHQHPDPEDPEILVYDDDEEGIEGHSFDVIYTDGYSPKDTQKIINSVLKYLKAKTINA